MSIDSSNSFFQKPNIFVDTSLSFNLKNLFNIYSSKASVTGTSSLFLNCSLRLENILQKTNINNIDQDYKVFTTEFDEIAKAEILEDVKETQKLRKNLDQQLVGFQDLITKLANKLQRQLLAKQNRAWEFDLEEGLLDKIGRASCRERV